MCLSCLQRHLGSWNWFRRVAFLLESDNCEDCHAIVTFQLFQSSHHSFFSSLSSSWGQYFWLWAFRLLNMVAPAWNINEEPLKHWQCVHNTTIIQSRVCETIFLKKRSQESIFAEENLIEIQYLNIKPFENNPLYSTLNSYLSPTLQPIP